MKNGCFQLLILLALILTAGTLAPWNVARAQEPEPAPVELKKAEPAPDAPAVPEMEAEPERKPKAQRRGGFTRRHGRELVEFGHDVVVGKGETKKNVVVIAGDVRIDGEVDQDVVVIAGSAEVNGKINGSLVVVLGQVKLGPEAEVQRETVVIGGPISEDPKSFIGGQRVIVGLGDALPSFAWLQQWVSKGLMLARPLPPQFLWVWVIAGMFLLLYLMLALLFPKPVQASVLALQERPIGSFFTGVLMLLLFGPFVFLLVVSVAGVLVIPFLVCATILAFLFGKAAVYSYAGQQVTRQFKPNGAALLLTLLIGALLFYVIYMVPVLGFVAWGVVTLLGLGAAVLAAFRGFRREGGPTPAAAPPVIITNPAGVQAAGIPPGSAPISTLPLPASEFIVMPRVGFWLRLVATFLDFLLLCMLLSLTGPFFVFFWAAYHIGMWAWKGTTIGGIVVGIKVVRSNGAPVDFSVALVRSLSSFFSALVLFLGFFWAGWDRDKQAWHDKIAGTVVVKVPKGISLI